MEKVVVELQNVHKNFILPGLKISSLKSQFTSIFKRKSGVDHQQKALNGVDFSVQEGEFFGIVGRNGSGKSTLLKLIAGIYQPNNGKISVKGKLVPFIELGVGFNPELTGRENVYLNGAMLGFSRKEIDEQYDDIVNFAELEKFMNQKLKNYSSGMQVRLAFACTTRSNADILLVDEVLAVGDADFQRKCFDYFRELKKQKKTVIFVTHDMNAVREFCDKAILIDKGKVAFSGSASDAAREYTRLFANPEDYQPTKGKDDNLKKWGYKKAGYKDIKVSLKGEKIKLELQAVAKEEISEPIFGFLVKNAAGMQILGMNNIVKQQKVDALKKDKPLRIEWEFPNIFSDGSHSIDVALTQNDGATVHEWWEDAIKFDIKNKEKTPYPITPRIDLSIR